MKKTNEDLEYEKMLEALLLERVSVPATMPDFSALGEYGYGEGYWWGYSYGGYARPDMAGKFDTIYLNKEGKKHRIYGPAYVSRITETEIWYKDGVLHREDGGPAVRHRYNLWWFKDGVPHRLDGPAIVNLGQPKRYYIEGRKYSPKEYKKEIARRKRKVQ
jgi:hypothetical protein